MTPVTNRMSRTPSVRTFTDAWTQRFAEVVREAAGKDGRLSLKEAARIAQRLDDGRHFADNALAHLERLGQQSISANKLIEAGRRYAFASAQAAAGPDGRLSAADAARLPVDLMEDVRALQGRSAPAPTPAPSADGVLARLTEVTAGMTNMSESDSPVVPLSLGSLGSAPITAQLVAVRAAAAFETNGMAMGGGVRSVDLDPLAQQPVGEGDPAAFLTHRATVHDDNVEDHDSKAYAAKWAALSRVVGESLSELRLFRFGTVEATYVLVGRTAGGELAGFMTGAVET